MFGLCGRARSFRARVLSQQEIDDRLTPPTAPVAAGGLADQTYTEDSAITSLNVAADFSGTAPITYALAPSSGALPAGLSLSAGGVLTGTPTETVTARAIVVRGTNSEGFDDTGFAITVEAVAPTTTTLTYASPAATTEIQGNRSTRDHLFGVKSVVVPEGGAAVNAMTPAEELVGGAKVHGAMLNPQRNSGTNSNQAFDQRTGSSYQDADNVQGDAFSLTPGDVLVKSVARTDVDMGVETERRNGIMQGYPVLYAVSSLPPVDAIPPSPIGWAGRTDMTWIEVDWDAKLAQIPRLPIPSGLTCPTFADFEPHMILSPIRALTDGTGTGGGYEVLSPFGWGGNRSGNANYGRYRGVLINEDMALALHLPETHVTDAQRKLLFQYLVIDGWWMHQAMKGSGQTTEGDGGHYRGEAAEIELSLWATDQTAAMDTLRDDASTNQYQQYFQADAAQIALLTTPHDEYAKPFGARRRNVTSVSALSIGLNQRSSTAEATSEVGAFIADDLDLVRESDGESALILDTTQPLLSSDYAVDIDGQVTPAFAVNDIVTTLGEPETRVVGTYHYAVKGITGDNIRLWGVSERDVYRGFAKDGALAFIRRAIGYYRPVHAPLEGYTVQTWDGDFPPNNPWPDPFETISEVGPVWAEGFVREHAPSVIPALAPPSGPVAVAFEQAVYVNGTGTQNFAVDLPAGKFIAAVEARSAGANSDIPTDIVVDGQTISRFEGGNSNLDDFNQSGIALYEFTLASAFNGNITMDTQNHRYNNMAFHNITGWDRVSGGSGIITDNGDVSVNVLDGDTLIVSAVNKNNNPAFGAPLTQSYVDPSSSGTKAYGGAQGVFSADASPATVSITGMNGGDGALKAYVLLRPA